MVSNIYPLHASLIMFHVDIHVFIWHMGGGVCHCNLKGKGTHEKYTFQPITE